MAIYVEYEGIKGNVTAEGYKDHIAVDATTFGVGRGISMEVGNLSNRESTKPSISEVTCTKFADTSTVSLLKEALTGSKGKKVKIKYVRTGADKVTEFMSYELEDALISSYSANATSEGEPSESLTISFSKVLVTYNDSDSTMGGGSPNRTGYDLKAGKPF